MNGARAVTLIAATVTMGLIAGVFGQYAYSIMRGLGKTDDRTFVDAFQAIDHAIVNPLFLFMYIGALVFTGLAAVLHIGDDARSALPWIVTAFVLYLATFVITAVVHLPLNDDIKAAGDVDHIANLAEVRDRFNEARWTRWNIVRAVLSTVGFGCLTWALVVFGRIRGRG